MSVPAFLRRKLSPGDKFTLTLSVTGPRTFHRTVEGIKRDEIIFRTPEGPRSYLPIPVASRVTLTPDGGFEVIASETVTVTYTPGWIGTHGALLDRK